MEHRMSIEGGDENYCVILTVYFCGTSSDIKHDFTQIGQFFNLTVAVDITDDDVDIGGKHKYYKMGFSGCGHVNGFWGAVFASGLDEQCENVVKRLKQLVASGKKVKLNCLGLSRGGMAILILVKKVAKIFSLDKVSISACLFDPVPGNLISSHKLDLFGGTLASQCLDVSRCQNLTTVLAIYPHEPLPDISFHAPIIPKYPEMCKVEEDVFLGCHQGALLRLSESTYNIAYVPSQLSFLRITQFLTEEGTPLRKTKFLTKKAALAIMDHYPKRLTDGNSTTLRHTHSWRHTLIVRQEEANFLNKHHRWLALKKAKPGSADRERLLQLDETYLLSIEIPQRRSWSYYSCTYESDY